MEQSPSSNWVKKISKAKRKIALVAALAVPAATLATKEVVNVVSERLADIKVEDSNMELMKSGGKNIENIFQVHLVRDWLNVPSAEYNSEAIPERGVVLASEELLKISSAKEISRVGEHEVLHLAVQQRKYLLSPEINASIQLIMSSDSFPPFAYFINEGNYFSLSGDSLAPLAGHSFSNSDEFLTSFIHSVLDADLLFQNLQKDYITNNEKIFLAQNAQHLDGSEKIHLTPKIREDIIVNYIFLLGTLIKLEETYSKQTGQTIVLEKFKDALSQAQKWR